MLRTSLAVIVLAGVARGCVQAPPALDPSEPSEPSPSERPSNDAGPLAGLLDPPTDWPDPIPTIAADGALSIRAIQLDPEPLLANSAEGEALRVRALVQAHEPLVGEPERTWCVDRTIDLQRLDQGVAIEPALRAARPGQRIELIATLERGARTQALILRPIAWTDDEGASWQTAEGAPVEPESWPKIGEPGPLLRRAADDRPLGVADDRKQALDFLARAALADEGALAERHARRALELAPDDVEVWSTLIAIYHGYGQHEHHLAALRAARARGLGELDGLWLDYGGLDVTIGEYRHAIPLLEQALALAPESLPAHFYLATARWLLGELEAARPDYAKVVELAGARHQVEPIETLMIETARTRLAELDGPQ
ncbi:hypothetical protein ACNOYE_27990 [Nannocystaceae bacterium ST9]